MYLRNVTVSFDLEIFICVTQHLNYILYEFVTNAVPIVKKLLKTSLKLENS